MLVDDVLERWIFDLVGSLVEITSEIVDFFSHDSLAFVVDPTGVSIVGSANRIAHLLDRAFPVPGATGLSECGRAEGGFGACHHGDN